jgi:flagellar biosynthesis/type III secretory pathway ATPase
MKKEPLMKAITVCLTLDDYASIRMKSEELGMTCAEYIRKALRERMKKDAKKQIEPIS